MTLHLSFPDRAEHFTDVPGMTLAERITDRHPEALLAVFDDGKFDFILRSPGRDVAFERFTLQLEWTECDEFFDREHSFFALDRSHAAAIAREKLQALMIDCDALLTDEEGKEVHL